MGTRLVKTIIKIKLVIIPLNEGYFVSRNPYKNFGIKFEIYFISLHNRNHL